MFGMIYNKMHEFGSEKKVPSITIPIHLILFSILMFDYIGC